MSSFQKINIDVSQEIDGFNGGFDLGAGRWLAFDYIPIGVSIELSFDNNSQSRISVKKGMKIRTPHNSVYLWTKGVSNQMAVVNHWSSEDTDIIYPSDIDTSELSSILEFIPNGVAIQKTIVSGNSFLYSKDSSKKIRVHSTDETHIELDNNGIKYPIYEEILNINNINSISFHNENSNDIILTILES